ncbi:CRTAC1 family protein [Chthonomonas calidirosea]|uniref:ASPIC and UnbV./Family description n=1 Tax=Chthonomonas calidirosea (strain DSM 23976 / ICMP 18418 / T49) TaxID=1303518 RepID=S0EYR3_CHTCT|nr:CRTAC1 family protein [Chthonomonas calidirosea]CCW35132.1 ASPIC and UnbV./Family description [Chthonomonas calidirosea T49]CEK20210.1 hypothetical protein CP488_02781 [Chthonomonas calidirosea]CEK20851.1 hypothetical protein CTKA_02785 [Chthonomonas calidirosea]
MGLSEPVKEQPSVTVSRRVAIGMFLALVGGVPLARWLSSRGRDVSVEGASMQLPRALSPQDSLRRYGFYLTECAQQCGIHFVHQAPQFDPKLNNIMPEVASFGASVSIVDFDRDGWADIFVTNSGVGTQCALYRNNHDGTFTDVTEEVGLRDLNAPGTGVCQGAVWGDYDNDGFEDLLVYKWSGPTLLFHNEGGKHFTNVTSGSGLPAKANISNAIWLDYNNDGNIDLLLCGYFPDDIDLFHLTTTKIMTNNFEYGSNGGRLYLLENLGGGRFEDVTEPMGLGGRYWALAAAAADLCGNGYPDIVIAGDYGASLFFYNDRGRRFIPIAKSAIYSFTEGPKSGMNVSFGDILNQGRPCIYISNISEPGELMQGNNLWVPQPGTTGKAIKYDEMGAEMGVAMGGWSFGAQFGDLNNDGYLDLYLTNGFYSGKRDQSYWHDFNKVAGANSAIISDAANWPPFNGRSLSGYEKKCVWLGDGTGHFTEVAQQVGATDLYDGRAVALADLWNNGALDVIVANQRGPLLIYRNTVDPKNRWIEFHLEGTRSNRSAIGAAVTLYWNHQQQLQFVLGGCGFAAENQRRLHFGLGPEPQIEKLMIRWPSGLIQTLPASSLRINAINNIKEP